MYFTQERKRQKQIVNLRVIMKKIARQKDQLQQAISDA